MQHVTVQVGLSLYFYLYETMIFIYVNVHVFWFVACILQLIGTVTTVNVIQIKIIILNQ